MSVFLRLFLVFFVMLGAQVVHAAESVQLITDQGTKTVTIVIDGKAVGQFTEEGLHVFGSITYEGTIRDTGNIPKKKHNKSKGAE